MGLFLKAKSNSLGYYIFNSVLFKEVEEGSIQKLILSLHLNGR